MEVTHLSKVVKVNTMGSFEPIKKTAVYCRISTSRTRQPSSLENQISGLITYVSRQYNLKLVGVYTDIGSGRSTESRKELKRLLADCDDGEVNCIVTKSISRFGRNTAELLRICRRLKEKKIDVYFMSENMHSFDPSGELSISLAAAVAEGESYGKSEAIKWGIAKSAENENSAIYSRKCYGYQSTGDDLIILEDEAAVVRRIFDSYLSGKGSYAIKTMLEKEGIPSPTGKAAWSKRTIEKMLTNEKYCGDVILYKTFVSEYPSSERVENSGEHKKLAVQNHHKAIIEREKFEAVQALMKERGKIGH